MLGMSLVLFIPALCHYRLVAKTKLSKAVDIVLMSIAFTMFFYGPFTIISQWR